MTEVQFPRTPDDKGHAYGLLGAVPEQVWERFSDRYEAQAEALCNVISDMGYVAALEWAGSQDGEAIIGRNATGEIVVLYHLEDPNEAEQIEKAIAEGWIQKMLSEWSA